MEVRQVANSADRWRDNALLDLVVVTLFAVTAFRLSYPCFLYQAMESMSGKYENIS